jgi:hypothetical protein
MGLALLGVLLCVACDLGTDDLSRKDPAWAPPGSGGETLATATKGQDSTLCSSGAATLDFYKADQAYAFLLDLEAGLKTQLWTRAVDQNVPPVDTVMALYGPVDTIGAIEWTPRAYSDDAPGASGGTEVWAAMDVLVPARGTYLLYVSTYDGAGRGPVTIGATPESETGLCRVDCGDATPLNSVQDLIAAIPTEPWPCNTASTPGPWPVTPVLCAKVPLEVNTSDIPLPDLPGVCGTSTFPKMVYPEVDASVQFSLATQDVAPISGLVIPSRIHVTAGTSFRLRTTSRIDTAHSLALAKLTFLPASYTSCEDEAWRCEADKVCYERIVDGIFDPDYLYCLGCDHLPADQCACRTGKDTAADGAWCSVPQGEGATSVTGTCSAGICDTTPAEVPTAIPYVEAFDSTRNIEEAGWTPQVEGTSTYSHWNIIRVGNPAIDGRLTYSGSPDPDLVKTTILSPLIDATSSGQSGYDPTFSTTVQWRSSFSTDDPPLEVTLKALAGDALAGTLSTTLWSATTTALDFDLYSLTLPAELKALDTLRIGFQVGHGLTTRTTGHWQIDRVVVAAGVPNRLVKARVFRCLDNGQECWSEAGGQVLFDVPEGEPFPTLTMDACEHWKVALCYFDPDATSLTWEFFGEPSLGLEGAPLDAPAFVYPKKFGVGPMNGCQTSPTTTAALCGTPAAPGYFVCLADLAPNCQEASAGQYDLGLVARDEDDPAKQLHSPLESMVKVRLKVAAPEMKACLTAAECADDNPCDADSCPYGFCRHSPYNVVPECCYAPAGLSPVTGLPWDAAARQTYADAQCNDLDPCTTDACGTDGTCSHVAVSGCVPT